MADISKIRIGDTDYDIKDEVARAGGGGQDPRIVSGDVDSKQDVSFTGAGALVLLVSDDGIGLFVYGNTVTYPVTNTGNYTFTITDSTITFELWAGCSYIALVKD